MPSPPPRPSFVLLLLALALPAAAAPPARPPDRAVLAALDDFHDAARRADEGRYFAHFAPDGVFLGTDATERWTVPAFRAWARPHFAKGKGWDFRPRAGERHLVFEPGGNSVFFDELLDNDAYGLCRGTGVLRRAGDRWLVVAYSLSFAVPNEVADDVVALIRRGAVAATAAPPPR